MEGRKSKGYMWAILAGLNAALAAISAKFISSQVFIFLSLNEIRSYIGDFSSTAQLGNQFNGNFDFFQLGRRYIFDLIKC